MTQITSAAISHRQMPMKRNRNAIRTDVFSGFGPVANVIILGIVLFVIGVLYITQVTKTNSFGYQINELKTQKASLEAQQQQLEVDIAKSQSLENLQASQVAQSLVGSPDEVIVVQN